MRFTACCLHDCGIIKYGRKDHEKNSALIAKEILISRSFDNIDIAIVTDAISQHRSTFTGEFSSEVGDLVSSSG